MPPPEPPILAAQAPIRRQNLQALALALSGLVRPSFGVGCAPQETLTSLGVAAVPIWDCLA